MQHEPWIDRDRAMIDMLKSIGIEKGKTFEPDQGTQAVLKEAIGEARAWLDNRYEGVFTTSFNEGQQWVLPALPGVTEGMMTNFANPNAYPVDGRGVAYSMAFFSAKHLGAGQYYLMTIRDKDRKPLDGNGTYRLNVPANAPVKLYWSATVYDRATHALIRGQPWSSRSSNTPKLQKNADGSVDVFFGPKAPAGKETNWVPTDANGRFEVLFRLYGPEKPFFDKTVGAAGHRADRCAVSMEVAMKNLRIQMCAGLLLANQRRRTCSRSNRPAMPCPSPPTTSSAPRPTCTSPVS